MKKTVTNALLVLICAMIILYTAASFALQYFAQVEISPTLTTAWFAFWATELVALAAIKTCKVKHEAKGNQSADAPQDVQDIPESSVEAAPAELTQSNSADDSYYSIDIEGVK